MKSKVKYKLYILVSLKWVYFSGQGNNWGFILNHIKNVHYVCQKALRQLLWLFLTPTREVPWAGIPFRLLVPAIAIARTPSWMYPGRESNAARPAVEARPSLFLLHTDPFALISTIFFSYLLVRIIWHRTYVLPFVSIGRSIVLSVEDSGILCATWCWGTTLPWKREIR